MLLPEQCGVFTRKAHRKRTLNSRDLGACCQWIFCLFGRISEQILLFFNQINSQGLKEAVNNASKTLMLSTVICEKQ